MVKEGFYVLCQTPSWCLSPTATVKEEAAGRGMLTSILFLGAGLAGAALTGQSQRSITAVFLYTRFQLLNILNNISISNMSVPFK